VREPFFLASNEIVLRALLLTVGAVVCFLFFFAFQTCAGLTRISFPSKVRRDCLGAWNGFWITLPRITVTSVYARSANCWTTS